MSSAFDIFNMPLLTRQMKKTEKDINTLALRFISSGSEEDFEFLVKRIRWGLRSFMYSILKDDYAVDECFSRTLEIIYFKARNFDTRKGRFSSWMYKVAYNNCLKYMNNEFGYGSSESNIKDNSYDIYENIDSEYDLCETTPSIDIENCLDMIYRNGEYDVFYGKKDIMCEIYDASVDCINKMPDNLRIVLKERYINKKKVNAIAIDNHIPVSSVKNWLREGVAMLRVELMECVPDVCKMYIEKQL